MRVQNGLLEGSDRSQGAGDSYNPFHIPWIAYLAPKLATGFVVPQGDMRIEHAQGGGLLLSATEDRFDPTNPDHLRRAHELAEIMIARTGDGANDTNPP